MRQTYNNGFGGIPLVPSCDCKRQRTKGLGWFFRFLGNSSEKGVAEEGFQNKEGR